MTYVDGLSSGLFYSFVQAALPMAGATVTPNGTRGRIGKARKGKGRSIHLIPGKGAN